MFRSHTVSTRACPIHLLEPRGTCPHHPNRSHDRRPHYHVRGSTNAHGWRQIIRSSTTAPYRSVVVITRNVRLVCLTTAVSACEKPVTCTIRATSNGSNTRTSPPEIRPCERNQHQATAALLRRRTHGNSSNLRGPCTSTRTIRSPGVHPTHERIKLN